MDLNALQHRVLPVGHLPVIRGLIDRLGFKEVIDRYLPQHPLAKVSDAECVVAMILNILSGRQSIWRIDQWLLGLAGRRGGAHGPHGHHVRLAVWRL